LNLFSAAYAPSAGFTAAPVSGWTPLGVDFTDTSAGVITNRHWNFGDGAVLTTTATSVSHTYTTGGAWPATRVVSGPGGSGTNVQAITATTILTPQITSDPALATNLVIVGRGTPSASYGLLGATSLLALTNHVPVASGTFDPVSGGSTNLVGLNPTNPAAVFRLKSPCP